NTPSFLLNFVIEPADQKQALSQKYPYYYHKGAGGICQVVFFVSSQRTARSLLCEKFIVSRKLVWIFSTSMVL
ncbi:MAG: hypothetical protein KTV72_01175, partial [Wolbachia endosymbiont of Melophagus ovinus]|nr:hypothetical protein [Wolbachia endosymbiont of Melophagus ovinus]